MYASASALSRVLSLLMIYATSMSWEIQLQSSAMLYLVYARPPLLINIPSLCRRLPRIRRFGSQQARRHSRLCTSVTCILTGNTQQVSTTEVGQNIVYILNYPSLQPGSETNCTKPICCRNNTGNTSTPTVPAGPYGEALKCDPPVSLADSMLEFAQTQGSSAKFSIFTGDVIEGS